MDQNYANHRRVHPPYHILLVLLTLVLDVSAVIELVQSFQGNAPGLPAFLFLIVAIILTVVFLLLRSYPLKVQDRAIRAEENLRHYVLTQKLLDSRLSIRQTIALRFASDEEFPALCRKAAEEQLSPSDIKKLIKQWRPDHYRV